MSGGPEAAAAAALEAVRPLLAAVREVLAAGGVVAFATESSYGLGVDPRSTAGVETIYRLKGRERGKPLPVVAADLEQIVGLGADRNAAAFRWGAERWPAPLTVVVPIVSPIAASAGRSDVAVRIPARDDLRRLLALLGLPLTATSANASGEAPITDVAALGRFLEASGEPHLVLDAGEAPGGPPSTLVEFVEGRPSVLRQGAWNAR